MAGADEQESRERVLFLCTYNSCPLADGGSADASPLRRPVRNLQCWNRAFRAAPVARKVLEEDGIDTSTLRSKSVREFRGA